MILERDEIKEIEEKIRQEIENGGFTPHKKLLPERKLCRLFNTSQYKIHTAIKRLEEKNIVYSKVGDGTYICERTVKKQSYSLNADVPGLSLEAFDYCSALSENLLKPPRRLLVSMPSQRGIPYLEKMWNEISQNFTQAYPEVELEISFADTNPDVAEGFDVLLLNPFIIREKAKDFMELGSDFLKSYRLNEDEFSDGIIDLTEVNGRLLGLPVFRIPGFLQIREKVLSEFDIHPEEFKMPQSIFNVGNLLEERSKGKFLGSVYMGFVYHAALHGIKITYSPSKNVFDFNEDKTKEFITEYKHKIKRHHINNLGKGNIQTFLSGRYTIFPSFSTSFPLSKEREWTPRRIPVLPDGFCCECCAVAAINKNSKNIDESKAFLAYLCSKENQEFIVSNHPHFLSVMKHVLEKQKNSSFFPSGSIFYDFNLSSYYTQLDEHIWFHTGRLNNEIFKYFSDVQSIEQTIQNIKN